MIPLVAVTAAPRVVGLRPGQAWCPAAVNWPAWSPWLSVSASAPPVPPPGAPVPARTPPDGSQV